MILPFWTGLSRVGRSSASRQSTTSALMRSSGPAVRQYIPQAELRDIREAQPEDGPPVNVLFIGAGNINFGSVEGPWNHSQRLEQKFGNRLNIVGIVDPAVERTEKVLEAKRATIAANAYGSTQVFQDISAAAEALGQDGAHAIIVGCPPAFRGHADPASGKDVELQLVKSFPRAGLLIEKPISAGTVDEAKTVGEQLSRTGNLVSVGYMLRYSKAVQKMKEIIVENQLEVMMTSARYVMAYEFSLKPAWWNKAIDCGPIVEQATHFVDLSRYFGGEVELSSILAHSLEFYDKPGRLSKMGVDESLIPESERIPRFTSASWRYASGAIGHLEHGVALQGTEFSTEFTVFCDGYQMKLIDPYNRPTLYIRRPGSDAEEIHQFHDDDPFLTEMSNFTDALITESKLDIGKPLSAAPQILSSYEDAVKTYDMTWAIRWASEKTRRPHNFAS